MSKGRCEWRNAVSGCAEMSPTAKGRKLSSNKKGPLMEGQYAHSATIAAASRKDNTHHRATEARRKAQQGRSLQITEAAENTEWSTCFCLRDLRGLCGLP